MSALLVIELIVIVMIEKKMVGVVGVKDPVTKPQRVEEVQWMMLMLKKRKKFDAFFGVAPPPLGGAPSSFSEFRLWKPPEWKGWL